MKNQAKIKNVSLSVTRLRYRPATPERKKSVTRLKGRNMTVRKNEEGLSSQISRRIRLRGKKHLTSLRLNGIISGQKKSLTVKS